jgi:neurotransmitter:Na+ symporter, NSS family
VYPAALQYLGRGSANILSIIWFAMIFLLGIDSLFSQVEATATVLTDTPRLRHHSKEMVSALICGLALMVSLAFASNIGLALIDSFDHYVINYALLFTGFLEAYTVSWVWGWGELSRKCGYTCASTPLR